jgi:hypothetical protein
MTVTQICILAWAILSLVVVAILLRFGGRSAERTRKTCDWFGADRCERVAKLPELLRRWDTELLIGFVFDPLPPFLREPVPDFGHVFQLLLEFWVFHLTRHLTALSGVLFVFQDFPHRGFPNAASCRF